MIGDFLKGASFVSTGCREFCSDKKAWKFAAVPLGVIILLYAAVFSAIIHGAGKTAEFANRALAGLPDWILWLQSCVSLVSCLLGIVIALILTGTTICAFYEIIGSLFFDSLTAYHERKKFGTEPRRLSFSGSLEYGLESFSFAIRTAIVFIFFFILSFFFPIAGQLLLITVMGYYTAVSFMISSGCNNGLTIAKLRTGIRGKTATVLGFGITAYLLLMIPFAALILLPGLVLGGSDLFNAEIRNGR